MIHCAKHPRGAEQGGTSYIHAVSKIAAGERIALGERCPQLIICGIFEARLWQIALFKLFPLGVE